MAYRFLTQTSFIICFLSLACLTLADPVVDLGYAKYRGNLTHPNTVAYLGIPYAEPPIGDHRFRAPLALNTSRVSKQTRGIVIDATSYPEFCIQGSTGGMLHVFIIFCLWGFMKFQTGMLEAPAAKTA